ncbi:carbohydrate esterase family 1 protein [Piromyces sp. E2]|nr:carbohydrate esterase family 1 protein [Piromyces sp. E2]|eukprot:OUM62183.1 carbohydrate esterase family 1 protein [Piromyces sp. E2]
MFRKLQKHFSWALALSVLSLSTISCSPVKSENYGITLRDTTEKFTIFTDGSVATDIVEADDGSVSWVATAAGGAGGGVAFYAKSDKKEINIGNYESIDIELDYSPVEGKWSEGAMNPGFCMRILPWDSTGIFGGYEDLEYFEANEISGTLKYTVKIPSDFAKTIETSSDFDSILGFAIKFNDYQRGNENGDQLKVQLKTVTFNPKKGAAEDEAFNDGLNDAQRGSVVEINYPTRDYTVEASALTDEDRYKKHAWVYLPAGYDASDKNTKYPLFILLHGSLQNENTWGLTNKGRGGKIKGYMDRGMASGEVEKFILVAATGVSSKNWGPNGRGDDYPAYEVFGQELRADLLPYMRANFNVKEGRDNVALAGLSRGGGQTLNIGIGQSLDLISHFASYSAPLRESVADYIARIEANPDFEGLKIKNLYVNCGDNDPVVYSDYPSFVENIKDWDRIENFKDYTYPGGTHDFPVWYKGFNDFIQMIFKNNETETPKPVENQPTTPVKKCKTKKVVTVTKCKAKKN